MKAPIVYENSFEGGPLTDTASKQKAEKVFDLVYDDMTPVVPFRLFYNQGVDDQMRFFMVYNHPHFDPSWTNYPICPVAIGHLSQEAWNAQNFSPMFTEMRATFRQSGDYFYPLTMFGYTQPTQSFCAAFFNPLWYLGIREVTRTINILGVKIYSHTKPAFTQDAVL